MIKKADIVLGVFLLLLCFSSLFLLRLADGSGTLVTISVAGKVYGTYELEKNQRIEIDRDRLNVIQLQDGAVFMAESDCANQVCVHQGKIRRTSQTIVCLPNKVIVTISGKNSADNGMDAISY